MSSPPPSYRDRLDSPRKPEAIELFSGLPARYDALSAALSFWQDPRWRRALVSAADPHAGDRVLDVATGTGMVAAELLHRAAQAEERIVVRGRSRGHRLELFGSTPVVLGVEQRPAERLANRGLRRLELSGTAEWHDRGKVVAVIQ